MRAPVGVMMAGTLALVCGCHHRVPAPPPPAPAPRPLTFTASRIRSFSDSYAVTAVADSPSMLLVGTPRGLVRWEGARYTVMTQKEGLPSDHVAAIAVDPAGAVWVATAKGLSRGQKGGWTNYDAAPVGSFLTGVVPAGRTVWAGGPEGLGRLRNGKWDHYFADTGITALAPGPNGTVWVGTSGAGVLRIVRNGEKIERWGAAQGCDVDVVRGLVAVDRTLLVVGENDDGPRAAWFDGERFASYELGAPQVIEWAARAGDATFLGAGSHIYQLDVVPPEPPEARRDPKHAPPPHPEGPVTFKPLEVRFAAPRLLALKPDLPSSVLDDGKAPKAKPTEAPGPRLYTAEAPLHLADGVTCVGGSERGLLVGTRFLGAARIENGVPRRFRIDDLATDAVRLTVACTKKGDDCFLATGATRAWHFDGQAFETAPVDPEPGSRVLAVLNDNAGDVLAIHRGADDHQLRISRVDEDRWTPIAIQAVQVPEGAPELNFAGFAPDGHLWVGLRYVDKDGDARDWGADEIALDSGTVVTHKELPTDVVAMYWKAKNEGWFATRSGAARLLDGKVRVFTENDGMESDITRDIGPGPDGTIVVATGRGTGRFDGTRWTFPRLGAYYHPANALEHDSHGNVFIGTPKGLFCVGDCAPDAIDARRGLLDDDVKDLAVDPRNRVWVLTAKGINIVEP